MSVGSRRILRVALPVPLRQTFDYLAPAGVDATQWPPGIRLRVPFGARTRIGLLLDWGKDSALPAERLRTALAALDRISLLPPPLFRLLEWSSRYYHHPVGEVFFAALPVLLRNGHPAQILQARRWRLAADAPTAPGKPERAPRQRTLLQILREHPDGLDEERLASEMGRGWRQVLHALIDKGWMREAPIRPERREAPPADGALPAPNAAQRHALKRIREAFGGHRTFLLEGVTGSGKTEVYLRATETALDAGRQVLILLPEIGLTPQIVARFQERFPVRIAAFHSRLGKGERLRAWLEARAGDARIVLGTRSAVWTPLRRPGLIVVDEEHDRSYKQQDGFRYSARDVAVVRARLERVPLVLGSATPSLESLHNALEGRYRSLSLPERVEGAALPAMRTLDLRARPMHGAISVALADAVRAQLERGRQVLLYLNRRGYAPVLLCHECGWQARCPRCDKNMTYHRQAGLLRCHHCDRQQPRPARCPDCGAARCVELGHGCERLEATLARLFPDARIVRIDSDRTRRKGSMEALLEQVKSGGADILVGTQMIAKGHHLEGIALVGVVDADCGLYSLDFRAGERMAQQIVQVGGRAGRGAYRGEVLIQTHHPDHPLLTVLAGQGYGAFARATLQERRDTGLPPYTRLALLQAEAPKSLPAQRFLRQARERLSAWLTERSDLEIVGPVAATMPRRAGRYRAQVFLKMQRSARRYGPIDAWLRELEALPSARQVRWSFEVDPLETS